MVLTQKTTPKIYLGHMWQQLKKKIGGQAETLMEYISGKELIKTSYFLPT